MSTAAHPESDDQIERVNQVLIVVFRRYATSFTSWTAFLSLDEFALNNAVHASTKSMPFFVFDSTPTSSTLLAVKRPTAPRG